MNRYFSFGFVLSTLVCMASCAPRSAEAGGDGEHASDPTSITVFGERVLLFMEYPHLVRGVPVRFLAHLTVLETGEPVRFGSLTLEIGAARLTVDAPKREGLFLPEGSLPEAGAFDGRLIVRSEQAEEALDLGPIVIHAREEEAQQAARAEAGDAPPNAFPFLMEPQWKVKLLLARAGSRTLDQHLIIPARAVAPEGMSSVVSSSIAGRLVSAPSGVFPRTGTEVAAGQALVLVEPLLGAAELAQLQALALEFDLKALDVLRATGEAEARVRFAEREEERIAKLRAEGLGTQQQLELAQHNLALARTELEAAGRTRESLDRLVDRRDAPHASGPGTAVPTPLEAPIAGTIVEVLEVPGGSIEPGQPVFRILDTSRIWVEGRLSEFDLPLLGEAPRALGRFAALPERSFELLGGQTGQPYIGQEVDPSSRTLLVRYELDNADGTVRPGMLAELHLSTGEHEAVVAIPMEAVVMDQGRPTAYVMLEGELFQKRDLDLGVKEESWVEVLGGIEPGERVATRGAYLLKLAALSPTSFGAGHAH